MSADPLDRFWEYVVEQLAIDPVRIPIIIAAAVGIYLSFLLIIRIFGVRVMSRMTAFDTVVVVMLGSVAGRVVIGHPPTLSAGIIGLLTLVSLEAFFGLIRAESGIRRLADEQPRAIFIDGHYLDDEMNRTHVTHSDLRVAMRRAGITKLSDVRLVVFEPTGEISLFRTSAPIEPELLKGVLGLPEGWASNQSAL